MYDYVFIILIAGADYSQLTFALSFTDSVRFDCIDFNITDDLIAENTESFMIGISVPSGNEFSGGITSASVNIIDNDCKSLPPMTTPEDKYIIMCMCM